MTFMIAERQDGSLAAWTSADAALRAAAMAPTGRACSRSSWRACATLLTMKRSVPVVLATTAVALLLGAGPASAQSATVPDASGDATGPGLDITRVTVRNLDRAVVAKVRFVRAVRGEVIVSIDPRGATGLRLVSDHRPAGQDHNVVLSGAFTDHRTPAHTPRCPGFRVRWSEDEPTVTMRMPSRCLHGGDYGAIRFDVLTERSAGDTDFARGLPGGDGSSPWVPRG